ncbi:MAG: hypothetical protein JXA14_20700, partial [Anaerolineae bacterium]|nr:hypothetical protein [Anaerolineae bacterium]
TVEELAQDCTVVLVPATMDLREEVSEYLADLKPELFELELDAWNRDPADWPAERTAAVFDAWFELEVHSVVYDTVEAPVRKGGEGVVDLTGTWIVVSSPDLDDDYLYLETTPYVSLTQTGRTLDGEFQIGLMSGTIDGRWEENSVLFSFEGADELDPVSGAGIIYIQDDVMILVLMLHMGDEFTFECELAEDADL